MKVLHSSAAVLLLLIPGAAAQSTGAFVIPPVRAGNGTAFAFWNQFVNPAGNPYNYLHPNPPGLLPAPPGADSAGNLNNVSAPQAVLRQTGSATCFLTSSGALYDFRGRTAFEVSWAHPAGAAGPVSNVIFQTMTGGRRFELNQVRLHGSTAAGAVVTLAPDYKALDDPQSGAFDERVVSAFQWNLTGRDVRDFRITFAAPGDSMPLWQAQLDVVNGSPFVRQLGYLLERQSLPAVVFGNPGRIEATGVDQQETRFFVPGQRVELEAVPEFGWEHVGWLADDAVLPSGPLTLTFADADRRVAAIFAPLDYEAWRYAAFLHGNGLLGQPNDYATESVSGPMADPDGDGLTNFAEYSFGGDPYAPDAVRAAAECLPPDAAGRPGIRWRSGPAEFSSSGWVMQWSRDLVQWSDAGEPLPQAITSREVQRDGSTMITARVPAEAGASLFLRVLARP
jgi:hypothetical protein